MDKEIFRDLSYGMYVVTSKDEKNVGCVINTLTQITSNNPIVSISLNKENYTNQVIKKTKKFAVSILSEETDNKTISTFGFSSSLEKNKFLKISNKEIDGLPVVTDNICGYLICEVIDIVDCETHDIFVSRVVKSKKTEKLEPMTYKYYHEIIKGKAPKKAPTYIEEETISDVKEETYVCDICGYVHKGPLPDDFRCPICGVDKSHFKQKK